LRKGKPSLAPSPLSAPETDRRSSLDLARRAYQEIVLYAPDRTPCPIDLSDNTNLFGIPPAAERAYRQAATATLTRYPALYAKELKAALAAYAGVDPSEVVTGCGSDDVLDSAIRAFAEPGEPLALANPTFAMVPIFAQMNALVPVKVPLTKSLDIDPEALADTAAKVIYVCSPNNPTGTLASRSSLERLLKKAPGIVLLDEAYAEFSGQEGFLRSAPQRENLLVIRTLSKAFGLAGLRIGYAVGPSALVAEVEKSRGPYKVSGAAERAAVAALTEDAHWVQARIADVVSNRARLIEALRAQGLSPIQSSSNFVLVPVQDGLGKAQAMRQRGVAVRPFPALPGIGDALRISVGPWEMMEAGLAALKSVIS
jgi:histidinol-phosphate aminotransferase